MILSNEAGQDATATLRQTPAYRGLFVLGGLFYQLSVFFQSLADWLVRPPPTSLSIKTFSINPLRVVPQLNMRRAHGKRIKEGSTL